MENRTKPSHSLLPLPRGEGEPANASSRFGECRLRSHAPKFGATAARPSPTRPNALAHSALPNEPSGSPSPLGRGRGEGEGISLSFTAFFSAVGSGLNLSENSEEPTGISLVDDANASSSFVEQPASAAGGVLLREMVGVRGNKTPAVPAASALDPAPEGCSKHGFEPLIISSLRLCRRSLHVHLGFLACRSGLFFKLIVA
jgi:hypothetical protein